MSSSARSELGGHVRSFSRAAGPRAEYGRIGTWLAEQAAGTAPTMRLGEEATLDGGILAQDGPTTSSSPPARAYRPDGWQGQTAAPLPGWETGNCVALGRRRHRRGGAAAAACS